MSNHALGCYYAPEHTWAEDIEYIRKLQPPVIRLFDNPDVQQIADMHALVPGAVIACRTWAIDDGSDEDHPSKQVNRINADPVGTAHDHAQQYRAQLDRWKQEASQRGLSLPDDQHIYFNSANEPNQGGELGKIATYSVAFLDKCSELGLRATAPCLGVGWPDNSGPGTPVNWQAYIDAGLEQAINRGHHWLELHEYFFKTGPQDNWTWWAGRHLQCPLNVPILLGEIGMDNLVADQRWDKEHDNRGWQGNATPDQYADMIQWHISHSDTRVAAALPFITDIRNREWASFNTRPAHGALLARKDACVPQATPGTKPTTPPVVTHLPAIKNEPPKTAYVAVKDGANIRSEYTVASEKLGAVPYGEQVAVHGTTVDTSWSNVTYGDLTGWTLSSLLSSTPPVTAPTPEPGPGPSEPLAAGIIDPRVAQAILNIESGGRSFGADGKPLIRFEAHIFKQQMEMKGYWDNYFRTDPERGWVNQEWRRGEADPWKPIHTGNQADEYAAFELAKGLDLEAAHESISMGAPQIMGFNHERVGFPTAQAMYEAFKSAPVQTIAFINYFLSDPALVQAMHDKDWRTIAAKYNGTGAVDSYSKLLQDAYNNLGAA